MCSFVVRFVMHKRLNHLYRKVRYYQVKAKKGTQTLKEHKKIQITEKLYHAIQEKATANQQTVDQYVQHLLEKALIRGDKADDAL